MQSSTANNQPSSKAESMQTDPSSSNELKKMFPKPRFKNPEIDLSDPKVVAQLEEGVNEFFNFAMDHKFISQSDLEMMIEFKKFNIQEAVRKICEYDWLAAYVDDLKRNGEVSLDYDTGVVAYTRENFLTLKAMSQHILDNYADSVLSMLKYTPSVVDTKRLLTNFSRMEMNPEQLIQLAAIIRKVVRIVFENSNLK